MRLGPVLLIAALFVTTAALPIPDTGAFRRKCRGTGPPGFCECMVVQMMRKREGRIGLDLHRLVELRTKAQQRALANQLARKYGTTIAGLKAVAPDVKYLIASDGQKCL
jgi:hypothetical protein